MRWQTWIRRRSPFLTALIFYPPSRYASHFFPPFVTPELSHSLITRHVPTFKSIAGAAALAGQTAAGRAIEALDACPQVKQLLSDLTTEVTAEAATAATQAVAAKLPALLFAALDKRTDGVVGSVSGRLDAEAVRDRKVSDERELGTFLDWLGLPVPTNLAQRTGAALVLLLRRPYLRMEALRILGKLEPAILAPHAIAVCGMLLASNPKVRVEAVRTLRALPRFITRGVNFDSQEARAREMGGFRLGDLRRHVVGRLGWYKCRLRLRVRSLVFHWYALPYRPSGPGHARDVKAWDQMVGSMDGGLEER